ncbi:MAG: NAD(P)-binding domain-containing protein [Alphaproteobacteria bacterium]|nr:NAD(P)-binding domain-containing protein [Alphaproteobacteria bacterium]
MQIAIIGAGNVGKALGRRLAVAGHEIVYGVRDPAKDYGVPPAAVREVRAAAAAGVILLATPWDATEAACRTLGPVQGRIIVDCTNPLGMTESGLGLVVGHATSGAERVAGWCPGASVYKSFNQTGFEIMADPGRYQPKPVMFVAGDDARRKPTVLGLVRDVGFEAIDAGPLSSARLLEPYAMVWIEQVVKFGADRNFAFALARPAAVSDT